MKHVTILLITTFLTLSHGHLIGQPKKEVEMTYLHKIPFPKLYKAGDRLRFTQLCMTTVDSVVQGTINFKASIGKVRDCKMSIRILSDTVHNYKVVTNTLTNTNLLVAETKGLYGNPSKVDKANGQTIYSWEQPFNNNQQIVSTLTTSSQNKNGLLISKIE